MAGLKLYSHPLSSYCQKALTAFYEKGVAFDYVMLGDAETQAELQALWPLGKFPVLVAGERAVMEASIIIEFLDTMHPEPALIPSDARAALDVRFMDRFFDNYVMTPMNKLVSDALREEGKRDPFGVGQAREALDAAYAWLDERMASREWACGDAFTLADCAAAPSLLYADWSYAIPERFGKLIAYRRRLLARPSYARALDEARPYRHMFPLGAPTDRD